MSYTSAEDRKVVFPGVARVMARLKNEGAPQKPARPVADPDDENEVMPKSERWPLPGLAPMTRVRTSFGDVHAVALRKGDLVKTRSGEFKKIVWLNRVLLDERFLAEKPDSNPVRIQAGALGPSTPSQDVMVSPRQIVCPTPKANLNEPREAAALEAKPGVHRQRETGLSYTIFHLGEPAEVLCDGVFLSFEPPKA